MDERAELVELIRQAKEHLRYYQEIGLTHVGTAEEKPSVKPAPVVQPATVSASLAMLKPESPPAADIMVLPTVPTVEVAAPPPPKALEREPAMNTKDQPELLSLFDTPAAPAFAAAAPTANETLEDIRRDLGECQLCKLWTTRANLVFGEGSSHAELMFVGEAPGADEDATGRPFVGRAGQLLTKMIEAIGLKREDVYIANILKSRPPNNRNPEADEIKACKPFLLRQIAAIKPKLIVTLGNPATQGLLETKVGITKIRGEFQPYPRFPGIYVLPTFHPAYLLRSPDKKREAWDDLKKVRAFLRGEITL
jgi:uracil-DNA glycosylase